jgi:hypothetical protein
MPDCKIAECCEHKVYGRTHRPRPSASLPWRPRWRKR